MYHLGNQKHMCPWTSKITWGWKWSQVGKRLRVHSRQRSGQNNRLCLRSQRENKKQRSQCDKKTHFVFIPYSVDRKQCLKRQGIRKHHEDREETFCPQTVCWACNTLHDYLKCLWRSRRPFHDSSWLSASPWLCPLQSLKVSLKQPWSYAF